MVNSEEYEEVARSLSINPPPGWVIVSRKIQVEVFEPHATVMVEMRKFNSSKPNPPADTVVVE